MKYELISVDGIQIIELQGSLEGGWETFQLKEEVNTQLGKGNQRFVIDMHKASFVNSTGIGVLVAIQFTVKNSDGIVKFCAVADRVRRSLQATGASVWENMDVYATREEALASFAAG